ncbi:HypC/HybG/HupF family hydrogenase formation chaperone [Ferrimicrobium sp.]|uniref:HypC/HybG/HupF family hydrogenase formation chaperone n=1 Tax=Ferrimicrobium sp. TaxID=2926050 RepID=UPI002633CF83|nr:HypC/HybG/HupF family hydrogenase formation chaperone [Ferrimicrobium sp.]
MCLGVPGRIEELDDSGPVKMGKVDFVGITREVCFASLPDVEVGDYVLVHVGFALTKLEKQNALETLGLFRSMGVLEDELGISSVTGQEIPLQ